MMFDGMQTLLTLTLSSQTAEAAAMVAPQEEATPAVVVATRMAAVEEGESTFTFLLARSVMQDAFQWRTKGSRILSKTSR
jgi:hypothetical protein